MRKQISAITDSSVGNGLYESDNLEDILMGKFKDLSSNDKKILKSSKVDIDNIIESRKKDGSLWTEDEVMNLIEVNDKVLYGALKHLYACQTDDEKIQGATNVHNGAGFNAYDAEFLTSVCKQLLERGFLTPKQKEVSRKKLKKYKKQLVKLANS